MPLDIIIGHKMKETLSYDRCPVPDMKVNVLEKIFETTFGKQTEELTLADLEGAKVQVTDFSGNKMAASLEQLWTAIFQFFDDGDPWMITEGKMVICDPETADEKSADRKRPKQPRQAADAATKVTLSPVAPLLYKSVIA